MEPGFRLNYFDWWNFAVCRSCLWTSGSGRYHIYYIPSPRRLMNRSLNLSPSHRLSPPRGGGERGGEWKSAPPSQIPGYATEPMHAWQCILAVTKHAIRLLSLQYELYNDSRICSAWNRPCTTLKKLTSNWHRHLFLVQYEASIKHVNWITTSTDTKNNPGSWKWS